MVRSMLLIKIFEWHGVGQEVLTCGMHSTFLQLTSDRLCLSALILYVATKEKEVMQTVTHHKGMHSNTYD